MSIALDGMRLYLSEHSGDCQVGGLVHFVVSNVDALHSTFKVRQVRISFTDLNYISEDDHRIFTKRCKAEYGDVLYSKDGATRGRPCFVDTDREFSYFVSVALIKPLRDRLDSHYLVHLLNSNWIKDRMADKSRGDMIPHIVLREIRAFPIPVPPLTEQRRIVADLDKLQTKVGSLKALQTETDVELGALMPSILDKAFRGEL